MLFRASWVHLIVPVVTTTLILQTRSCQGFLLQQPHHCQTIFVAERNHNSKKFITTSSPTRFDGCHKRKHFESSPHNLSGIPPLLPAKSTTLHASLQEQLVFPILSKTLKKLVIGTTIFIVSLLNYRRILWPGSLPDKSFNEPIPPGRFGCPFFGVLFDVYKPFHMEKKSKIDFNESRLKFMYAFFEPIIFASGKKNVKQILKSEFDDNGAGVTTFFRNEEKLLGGGGILFSNNKAEHGFLRRLVGNAMTPSSVSKAMPKLQETATTHVNHILQNLTPSKRTIIGEKIFRSFTLDVAGKVILGLDLSDKEQAAFQQNLDDWLSGLLSFKALMLPGLRFTKVWKSRQFLVQIIEDKIRALKERGPDGESTLSAMVFATDDEDGGTNKSLSHEQIVDNILFLMLAGSETSSNTMTNCLLLLGLHPHVWKKVVDEQRELCKQHGESLTKEQLDNDCPYLEAVIKETMRIIPISGGQYRRAKKTMIVDGMQIPKGWPIIYNVRKTHELDPSTRLEDGSHMDVDEGFKPERWLDKETKPKDGDYIPFGSGPRYCLGVTLAMAEMKTFLAIMARKFTFELVDLDSNNIEWKNSELIAIPKDGVIASIKPS